MSLVLVEKQDRIAWVTLNRPEKMNALNNALLKELEEAIAGLEHDAEVGVVVLTGAGEKAFVAGADISELKDLDSGSAREQALKGQAVFNRIAALPKPVIAAVNGFALGGGCELALSAHIRVASENARFGLPEVSLGIIPGYGGTQRLPRLVGTGVGLDMILSGDMIPAADALRMGLVSRVFPLADLKAGVEKLAKTILSRGPLALTRALAAVQQGVEMPLEQGLQFEAALFGLLAASQDMKEGMGAFLEKRPAQFKGC
ncbi:MAG: enoyl-CoA hydratase/isomerase family protein [Acidobacteria bacterium]|nr:enoyl-CoA hydratase/isomerase family protein [Acidobacteriota bacterium]